MIISQIKEGFNMYKAIIIFMLTVILFFAYKVFMGNEYASENRQAGIAFLAENSQKEGVTTTASGLQYKVLTKGEGSVHPTRESNVTVNYHGTLINGTIFDSSLDRGEPVTFDLDKVIPGWIEGVELMVSGDKYRFFIPSDLAYKDRAIGKIPAGSLLIFDIELISINE